MTNARLAVVRLHGRTEATWNLKNSNAASDRFNYNYSEEELIGLLGPIRELSDSAQQVHVIFDNNFEDQGQKEGQLLLKLLGGVRRQARF